MIKLTIYDGATPMLDKIASVSYGLALDVLDQAGQKVRKAKRKALKSTSHGWDMKISKNGKRYITYDSKKKKITGGRKYHKDGNAGKPESMANFVTSYLMERNMTVVIGGMHPTHTPKTRRNGKVVGYQAKQKGITEKTYAILEKLDTGVISDDYKRLVRKKSMPRFKNAKYKARNWSSKGYLASKGEVTNLMTTKYATLLGKQLNNIDVKVKEIAS